MNEDLQQQLMEFVYGLLDEGDANALCERITSDPQVARAYATVKLQCDLVARAARYDAPTVAWSRPTEDASSNTNVQAAAKVWSEPSRRRLANWCIGVAASGLICLMGSGYWLSPLATPSAETPIAFASATPVTVVLTGPSKLDAEASNPFSIQVENQAGTPVSTTMKYRAYDALGAVRWQDSMSTDQSGVARFDLAAALSSDLSRLEITTADNLLVSLPRKLEASSTRLVTYLRMDRPLFQPGERVSYRAVTLSRFGLRSDRQVATSFEIVNASDERLEASATTTETEHGVASGTFVLPSDLTDGTYTLLARSPDNLFREEWRDFQVRHFAAPRWQKKLELARDSYTVGDQVELYFSVSGVAGKPLADIQLQVQATVDGVPLATPEAKTDTDGKSRISLSLPESIELGEASVSVTVQTADDPAETITKDIPINLGKVNVDFYPEGGDLAADLPSRVYFYGRDPLGKPVHIEGRIVDSGDQDITDVVTGHEGRGVFSITPVADEQYHLVIDKPSGVTKEVLLPVTSADRFAVLETGRGVFAANAPIAYTLHQRTPPKPLTVAAYCRGAMVGQQTIDQSAYRVNRAKVATFRGEFNLPVPAQGVIRLTVFDATPTPPEPIAERLVYRRVGQMLDVKFTPDTETFAPGQAVQLDLAIRDENDRPVPAALGISIVDDAVLNLADDKSMRMPTYFHLLTEIDSPEQLEDANFYLSDKPESVAALDSLLGTQGWRRFTAVPEMQLAQSFGLALGGGGGFGGGASGALFEDRRQSSRYRTVAWTDETSIPLSTATTIVLTTGVSPVSKAFARPVILAGAVLLLLVGAASLRWLPSNRSLRVVAGIVAVGALVAGVLSLPMNTSREDQTADSSAPTPRLEVAMASGEAGPIRGVEDAELPAQPSAAMAPEGLVRELDEAAKPSAAPQAAAQIEAELLGGNKAAPKSAVRIAEAEKKLGRDANPVASEKAEDLASRISKDESMPLPSAQRSSAAAALPESSLPESGALSRRRDLYFDQSESLADKNQQGLVTREYTKWFYFDRSSSPPTDPSSSTIFWLPLFMVDETGNATIYFNLPQRPASFRAIVEAHGASRLGSGELLIDSREP